MLEDILHFGDRSRGSSSRFCKIHHNRPDVDRMIVHQFKKVVVDQMVLWSDACSIQIEHEGYRTSVSQGSSEVKAGATA